MTAQVSTSVRVRSHFARSVNIERDAPTWLDGFSDYIITPLARQVWRRITESIRSNSKSSRAWTVTGPYGTGKSAFALALAQLLGPGSESVPLLHQLEQQDPALASEFTAIRSNGRRFLPILITGQWQELTPALWDGLVRSIKTHYDNFPGLSDLLTEAETVNRHEARAVVGLVEKAAAKAGGVLFVIDELGKFVEYATLHPDKDDLYSLQLLAEAATRSAQNPLLVITILHQAFTAYGAHLTRTQREEYAKIQGRFEDLSFHQPLDQMLRLIHAAIEFSPSSDVLSAYQAKARELARQAIRLGIAPASMSEEETIELLVGCAPLHPVTALLLGPVFRKISQNERSIFSFLGSFEPHGFQDVLARLSPDEVEFYTPDRLYDYVVTACGTWLYQDPIDGRRWAQIESTLHRLRDVQPLDARVIKTTGLMTAVGEQGELRPSLDVLRFALMISDHEIRASIDRLVRKSALVFRAFLGSYRLWGGSDVDIEERLRIGRASIDPGEPVDQLLTSLVDPRPIMVRRHSYETGTLRFFHVEYILPERLEAAIENFHQAPPGEADGLVAYVLLNVDAQIDEIASILTQIPPSKLVNVVVVPIVPPRSLRDMIVEKLALKWVEQNTPELRDDDVARHELRSRMTAIEDLLNRHVESALEARDGKLCVLHGGTEIRLPGLKALNVLLSDICDRLYHECPPLQNELINRNSISPAATAARRNLLKAMIQAENQERLGIKGYPPEFSMYRSLLQVPGVHCQMNGKWALRRPEPGTPLDPVWNVMEEFLATSTQTRRPLSELWSALKKPPLGLRNGVIPVFICALLLERHMDVALFEDGTFVPELTPARIERFVKAPDKFEIRYCPIEGVRREVFNELRTIGIESKDMHVIAAVRPLIKFVANLPPYSQNTQSVSRQARDVRRILRTARDPDELLFDQLPQALGLSPFTSSEPGNTEKAREFARRLQTVIRELHLSYDRLLERISHLVISSLGAAGNVPSARKELELRSRSIITLTADLRMKAFLGRLSDMELDDRSWIESLAAFLVSRPPQTWGDSNLGEFESELAQFSTRFRALEDLALAMGKAAKVDGDQPLAIRVGLTVAGGEDYHHVVVMNAERRERVDAAVKTLFADLQQLDQETRLAAVTKLLKDLMARS